MDAARKAVPLAPAQNSRTRRKNHEIHLFGIHQTRNTRRYDQARDMNPVQLMAQHPVLKYGSIFEIRAADLNELMKASEQ
jgi:hypothetical protein